VRTINNRLFLASTLMVLITLLWGCATPSQVFQSHNFQEKRANLSPLCLILPEVKILEGPTNNQAVRQPEDEATASKELVAIVAAEMKKRGLEVVIPEDFSDENVSCGAANTKVTTTLDIFRRSSADNLTESVAKVTVGLMTGGLLIPYKNVSGWAKVLITITEQESGKTLWNRSIFDYSHRMAGKVTFNLERLVGELLEPLP
jgi:hypothetical protein